MVLLIAGILLHTMNVQKVHGMITSLKIEDNPANMQSNSENDNSEDSNSENSNSLNANSKGFHSRISKHLAQFQDDLSIPQGSNFNAMAITAWLLLFVAVAYRYFLTPHEFENFNYFHVAFLASSPLGFLIFGVIVMGLTGIIAISLPKIYSFYEIPIRIKLAIMLTVPILIISIICTAYMGTRYPENSSFLWAVALLTILISQMVLLSPVYAEMVEGRR
jgi:hypothetical protein